MTTASHYRALETMYASAPLNIAFYTPAMTVEEGCATITMDLRPEHHHSAGAAHGSIYFKMLDDAAFFAANSLETETFVLTSSFTTYLIRPVVKGTLRSEGRVLHAGKTQYIAESIVYDEKGREVGRGNGVFVKGRVPLDEAQGYSRD